MWNLKKGYKQTYLQNRNKLIDSEKLLVTIGGWGRVGEGLGVWGWHKRFSAGGYSTENSTPYSAIVCVGKASGRNGCVYMNDRVTLLCSRHCHNRVNQLRFNETLKNEIKKKNHLGTLIKCRCLCIGSEGGLRFCPVVMALPLYLVCPLSGSIPEDANGTWKERRGRWDHAPRISQGKIETGDGLALDVKCGRLCRGRRMVTLHLRTRYTQEFLSWLSGNEHN